MSQECWKIENDFCRCCHSEGNFTNLTESYDICGNNITLVDLLRETLNIDIIPIDNDVNATSHTICEECKIKLQEAAVFKMQVLHCEKRYKNMYCKSIEGHNTLWSETYTNVEVDVMFDVECEISENTEAIECQDNFRDEHNIKSKKESLKEEIAYEDVEFLEEDTEPDDEVKINKESDIMKPKPKETPKKGKQSSKLGKYQRYLQYTEEDLRSAMQAVKDNRMSRLEASEYYKVPRKTIAAHLQAEMENPEARTNREIMYNFFKEIKTILTFTNATPFKSKRNHYQCAYCTQFTTDDPVELRNHTRTAHINDRTKKVDIMMRPHCMNEILRVDVEKLLCVVCCTVIQDWNSMFQHLKTHEIELEQAYTRVIPYSLGPSNECVLCREEFISYMILDAHMNTHYKNYVCGNCGDVYLTSSRLKKHMESHAVTPSKVIWNKESVLKKLTSFKCQHCPARFPCEGDKRKHLLERHVDKVPVMTCEQCGKLFQWDKSYRSHMKNVHGNKYQCTVCGKIFGRDYELKEHEKLKHS